MALTTADPAVRTAPDASVLSERLAKIVTDRADSPFGVPGAVFGVADSRGEVTIVAEGRDAAGRSLDRDSPMAIASASKLAAGLLILRLVEQGLLRLDGQIGAYLPQAAAAADAGVTIARMLSHTSGLPLEIRHDLSEPQGPVQWQEGLAWPGPLVGACLETGAALQPGSALQYSNVAYGLLAIAAEQVTGEPYGRLLSRHVFEPLQVEAWFGAMPSRPVIRVADVPSEHAGTVLEPYTSEMSLVMGLPWAGVITDARGLLSLVRAYRVDAGFLPSDLASLATTDQTGGVAGGFRTNEAFLGHGPSRSVTWDPCPWGLAVEVQGGKQPHWAPPTMPGSFGQIGSSGCLAWHDPASGVSWAFLGARTTESGWLLRHGARIAQSAIRACRGVEPAQAPH